MTEIKIQNGYRRKRPYKKYVHKRNQESNHCAKNVLQYRILKTSKTDVNGAKVQTAVRYVQFDIWARTGTKRCNVKTGKFVYLVQISF